MPGTSASTRSRSQQTRATIIASIGVDGGVHADFGSGLWDGSRIGIPYVVVHGKTTPKSRVTFEYADESDKGPYPIPANVPIEGGSDHHALIVDRDSCKLYELYALQKSGSRWSAGSGAIWSLRSNALRPGDLDLGRRRRPPDPARARALGRRRVDRVTSITRSASRCSARATPSSTPHATRPRARAIRRFRPWDCGFA